ncbi:hypothetical protein [Microcoleus sp. D2_18a_B4]|uniref:hypothetical protein n=1 Tax=Microcoleus sp. D2_18a_B4 TaxID=3055329 RepID=UPI002FD33977
MILQSIAPEARSSATDYVADVTDVRKTQVRQCPISNARCPMPDARCLMPLLPQKNAGTVYHCRLPPSADPLRGEH